MDQQTYILSKKETKKFVRANNYLNRKSYNQNSNDDIFFNVGKRGKVLICNTTQCLHRAGIPEEGSFRDLLIISVLAIPQLKQDIIYYQDEIKKDNLIIDIVSNDTLTPKLEKYLRENLFLSKNDEEVFIIE